MPIISLSLTDKLLERFDKTISEKGYSGRSEAMRELIRGYVSEEEWADGSAENSVAVVSILYEKDSSKEQVSQIEHESEKLIQTTLHTHLDGMNCLEVLIVKGNGKKIESLVKKIKGVKGVKQVKYITSLSGI